MLHIGAMGCLVDTPVPDLFGHLRAVGAADRIEAASCGKERPLAGRQEDRMGLLIAISVVPGQTMRAVPEPPCRMGMIRAPVLAEIGGSEIPISFALQWPICLPDSTLSRQARLRAAIRRQRARADAVATGNLGRGSGNWGPVGCVSVLARPDVRNRILPGDLAWGPLIQRRLAERICARVSGMRPCPRGGGDRRDAGGGARPGRGQTRHPQASAGAVCPGPRTAADRRKLF
ncbi:hypothetical protein [Mangrovicoccus sp. HB161399]|uniref:hypothetical protein n=1 Tax=Mangrovicoccus sp. HB161399 TaxID=2720392 RepID=UPI0015559897|nr:hypothetical protein [Mangrovicoccus sp. HB161399]